MTAPGHAIDPALRADIVLEQTLGHVTHGQNLQRLLPTVDGLDPRFVLVPFDLDGPLARVPGYRNWTLRAGVRARRLIRALPEPRAEVRFVHTQVPAVLLGRRLTEVPTVVSLDAPPERSRSDTVATPTDTEHPC